MDDKTFHEVYKADVLYRPIHGYQVCCHSCGTKLKAYYAEDRLYAVKCGYCDTVALVKAESPAQAAMIVGKRVFKERGDE